MFRQPSVLAGGCYSGQVCWWDLRSGSQPSSATSSAHTEPVYCLVWTSSKTGTEVRLVVVTVVIVVIVVSNDQTGLLEVRGSQNLVMP